jgi:beta-lactamase class A
MRFAFIALVALLPMLPLSHFSGHFSGRLSAQEPAEPPPLADQIAALTKDFKGTVVLYAKNLRHGKEVEIGADTRVRTASTIKLPILAALESLVAAGKVKWDERIALKPGDKVSGSGVLGSMADNTDLTVRNLAILMIIVSDNTATNLILDRITADAVNDYLDTIGLTVTRSNRKVRGDGTKLAAPTGWSKAGQKEENSKYGLGVSTPREMVKLLEMLHQGKIVSPEASKDILEIMKNQQVKDGIGRHELPDWTAVASKSGSLDALRSDVGIVYTKSGPIAMAITVDGMPVTDYSPDNAGDILISKIAHVLAAGLAKCDCE